MNCINCGAPVNPKKKACSYCQTYYSISKYNILKNQSFRKRAIYPTSLFLGLFIVVGIYGFMFDSFSETMLVQITPVWYFLIIVGLYGYKAEDLINDIVSGKSLNFSDAYSTWLQSVYANNLLFGFLASILFFPFPMFKKITPLFTAFSGALIWGALLSFFFAVIFPAL